MSPDSRSSEDFAADFAEAIAAGDWEGSLIPLRGTTAAAHEANEAGYASLHWREGTSSIQLYGKGGQSLDELIDIAESMRGRGGPPFFP